MSSEKKIGYNTNVKQEPIDPAEEEDCNFSEQGEPCTLSEIKEEDDEEDLMPPVGMFLAEVTIREVKQEEKDSAAMCNGTFQGSCALCVGELK
ncbi:hypothetical protein R5R35_001355 [Gryllus longicercus]|uniref:Uncharacterized protein n=1 Tax=Gryllus longicercus TaxID=2509291 RepID=A0AAN9Z495_9ORTH